jgi:hypothetical protein
MLETINMVPAMTLSNRADQITKSEAWPEPYSLEFFLGIALFHERIGTGQVWAVDDERECLSVCFKGVIHMEIFAPGLGGLNRPWHIDMPAIQKAFANYRATVDSLQKTIKATKQSLEDLQQTKRWDEILNVILAPSDIAIILQTETNELQH